MARPDARTTRLVLALSEVASLPGRHGLDPAYVEPDVSANMLRSAGPDILRGQSVVVAVRVHSGPGVHASTHEHLILDVIVALCGSAETFDRLPRDRRATVLRYALAVIAQGTAGWGPDSTVSPAHSLRIGDAWHEVAALRAGRKAA